MTLRRLGSQRRASWIVCVTALLGSTPIVGHANPGDTAPGAVTYLGTAALWASGISADGRYVLFFTDIGDVVPGPNNHMHVYLRDRQLAQTFRLPVTPNGDEANGESWFPVMSGSGRRGADASLFSLAHRCGIVAVGASCAVRVIFSPTTAGLKAARVRFVSADGVIRVRDLNGAALAP